MLDVSKPPVEQDSKEGDPSPCPEDKEFFVRPDAAGMEVAIVKMPNISSILHYNKYITVYTVGLGPSDSWRVTVMTNLNANSLSLRCTFPIIISW